MGTLADLRTQCRALLASVTDWPNATLDAFIADAIRTYSATFPRHRRHTLTLATGTQAYALPGGLDLQGVVGVRYPVSVEPARFLVQSGEGEPLFQGGGAAYALRLGEADTVAVTAAATVGTLVFAETVATGETAEVEYLDSHHIPAAGADTDVVTVPDSHWEALIAFVDFRCHWEAETDETVAASSSSLVLSQLGENGRRAWNRWKEIMDRLEAVRPVSSRRGLVDWSGIGL